MVFLRFLFLMLAFCWVAVAQTAKVGETLVILPFENESHAPGLEWIGDSFPEILGQGMNSNALHVLRREERLYAFDRLGIPTNVRPSHATSYRVAQELDVNYVVFGQYQYDGKTFTASAQLLNMEALRLMPLVTQSGPLPRLIEMQAALAWDLVHQIQPDLDQSRDRFMKGYASIRLEAFENYVRGLAATARPEQIRHFKEALRLSPDYMQPMFQLGKNYYNARDYSPAISWLSKISKSDPLALEANFYLGLAAYYTADFGRAEAAFNFLSTRLPLSEVYNNLGVVTSRRGKRSALDYFRKAVEADPHEPDYRFNFAVNLYRQGDLAAAATQLREMLAMRNNDREAQALLETVTAPMAAFSGRNQSNFPLERIKANCEDGLFRQPTLEVQPPREPRTGTNDSNQPLESSH